MRVLGSLMVIISLKATERGGYLGLLLWNKLGLLGAVLILTQMVQTEKLQLLVKDSPVQILKNGAQPFHSQTGEG